MQAFVIELDNKPGELARLTEAIAQRGINIIGISAAASGATGAIGIGTNDDAATRSALEDAGISFREIQLVSASIEDKPGTLADATRRLANAGVNIEMLMSGGRSGSKVDVIFGVDNVEAARSALGTLAGAATG